MTEGPFYFDADKVRSDIRDGRDGTPRLSLAPRPRLVVRADRRRRRRHLALRRGRGVLEEADPFLRGVQVTNRDGIVEFTTIYPGWYQGRTVHIHAKVHLDASTVLTTQLFFDDAVTDRVYAGAVHLPRRAQRNDSDGIFDPALVMDLSQDGDGYVGTISFDVEA